MIKNVLEKPRLINYEQINLEAPKQHLIPISWDQADSKACIETLFAPHVLGAIIGQRPDMICMTQVLQRITSSDVWR
jgi:hypothetical protein